ncbi:MAG: VOC family protein [Chloroflexota bacterium]|nr:VOC family protein [Chloroflexota bacterium]
MTIREGFHTITPYLVVQEAAQLIDFVKQVFDATELSRGTGSAGGMHAEVRIGDSMLMIGGGGNSEPMPAMLYLYLHDVDAVYKRALQAGATSVAEPAKQSYGERVAGVKDPFGNLWYIGTPE